MFEAHVLYFLRRYLGQYVRELSTEALKISVWKGDVVLKDLQLKAEALNALKLPITVKAGFLGSVTLKVPWNRLGKEPVIVILDRVFVLAEPVQDGQLSTKEEKEKWLEAKRQQIEELEVAMLEAKDKGPLTPENIPETTWIGSLIATIIGNLKISVTNVHIRYEDVTSNPGHPFCSGVTLHKLAAVTTDESGAETFVTSGALDRLRKSLQLECLSVYHDSDTEPWVVDRQWKDMTPQEWSKMFEPSIQPPDGTPITMVHDHQYLLHPVKGVMRYQRYGKREKREPHVPFQKASMELDQVSITLSEAQYRDGIKLLENTSNYRRRLEYVHYRPLVSVKENCRSWWLYACQAVLQQQRKTWFRFSWEKISHSCHLRRRYVQLYATSWQQGSKVELPEIKTIDEELDIEVILLWRLLAHAKVEGAKLKAADERVKKGSWWPFGRASQGAPNLKTSDQGYEAGAEQFTREEWNKINELLSYQPAQEIVGADAPNMLQTAFDITIKQSLASFSYTNKLVVLCGTFTNLYVGLKSYPMKTIHCDVRLTYYGLSGPEGSLIESVSREGREHALLTSFVHHPLEDWKLSATLSPCHVTVWRRSFDRFLEFVKSGQAASPTVALETAAALQSKLEEVTRRAQEQLQLALTQRRRFSIDLDLDAPKVRIPTTELMDARSETQLLLDLGHFKLHTACENDPLEGHLEKGSLYTRCYVSGSDISAFFVDGAFLWSDLPRLVSSASVVMEDDKVKGSEYLSSIFPVLDRCGMSIILDQCRVEHPSYPATRVAIQVPRLGLHFSPARYLRLLKLLKSLEGVERQDGLGLPKDVVKPTSWDPAEFAGSAHLLLWGGIANIVAEWQTCWIALAGPYLYILESKNAQNYQRCWSMYGKQVVEIPPHNVGNSQYVIAVCNRGIDAQKVVESSNAIILKLEDDEAKTSWLRYLTLAIYRASAPASLTAEDESTKNSSAFLDPSRQLLLFVAGQLNELCICISGKTSLYKDAGTNEIPLLELQAHGGKVNLLQRPYDMTIAMKLHTLKIEDKLQGPFSECCQYIACSVLMEDEDQEVLLNDFILDDEYENFKDALPDFGGTSYEASPISGEGSHSSFARETELWKPDPLSILKTEAAMEQLVDRSEVASDFVNVRLIMKEAGSPDYDGCDTQISINMAKLDFFCNRPTVVALIDFGIELSEIMESVDAAAVDTLGYGNDSTERRVVKGLLGRGKSRVVFHLKMDMESVHIFLNQEDGSQLAMLAQEKFKMDLKVFPGSFNISGTLGNLRVCYMTLGFHHHWGWLCDIRDPTCGSLVELEFQSYNKDDDDFPGYDYSLAGKLSAVRIVFLYKFVQEVTAYFAALATPQSQHVITVVDKVGGLEHLIQQTDLEGSAALKLDLSMDTPTIIMPRCSDSREFMQLDLGHLQLSNKFEWRGGDKSDAGAVHLDVLNAEMSGINMVVGIEGEIGKPMIQEACGLHVKVLRSLRDVFRKVPQVQVDVEIGTLRAVISDKEYLVITDCAATNVAELPSLPPNFRDPLSSESDDQDAAFKYVKLDEQSSQFPKSNDEQAVSVWTLVWVRVDVQHADLELYIGLDRDSALARVEIIDLWLGYRTSSMLDVDIYLTLPKLLIVDLRPGIKPEMRLMFGSMSDVETTEGRSSHADENLQQGYSGSVACMTLLMMDLRMKPDSKALVIRMQRPRLLVVVDFLLAITEFIVPSLVTITGQTGIMAVGEDPLMMQKHIRLIEPLYMQQEETVVLSSNQRLFADACGIQEFIYDGSGQTLHLNISNLHGGPVIEPLVIIGPGKKLRFKNVRFKNGLHLHDCIRISPGGCYSVSHDDGVVFDDNVDNGVLSLEDCLSKPASPKRSELQSTPLDNNFMLDLQVISPEFTFYDSTQWPAESSSRRERLLRAKFDFSLMLAVKDDDMWVRSFVKGLSVEGGSGILVLDPLEISVEYVCVQKKMNILVRASDISTRLSFNVLRLVLRLHNDALSKFNFGASILSRCTHFDRIWVNKPGQNTQPEIAFWRPHAPPGYVILNDCATSGSKPPSQAVVAVSNAYHRVKKPLYFELLWCSKKGNIEDGSSKIQEITNGENCCVWLPIAPAGYVTLGCVVERGCLPPSTSVVHCIRKDLVASAAISDCIFYIAPDERSHKNGCSIWRIENATGSFYFQNSVKPPPKVCNLRDILYEDVINSGDVSRLAGGVSQSRSSSSWNRSPSSTSFEAKSSRASMITAQFEKMWWDRGSDSRRAVSIWRPIPLPGYAIIGDTLVEGLEPPGLSIVLRDDASGRLAKPVRFQQRLFISSKGVEDVCIWFPVAPTGYVALGCIVTKTANFPPLEIMRCVRMDLVNQSSFSKKPMWIHIGNRGSNSCCLWRVENQANTFIARADLKKPPPRLAYSLAETEKPKLGENLSAEVKIGKLSAMIIDDLGGQMTPLMDTTLTGVNLAAHGSTEAISAVALMSIAASIFNSHLESWEPLIEPFDGIVKYEFYDGTSEATLKVGKRLRVTAANTVNINITSAGLEVLLNAALAWQKETEFEQQAQATLQLMQEEEDYNQDFAFENAALETGETERLVVENNLYRNLYLRTNHANIQIISASTTKTVLVSPPTLSNRLADMVERRPPRQFVAVHVIEAKDLYALDDGHCPEFLCALRLVTLKQSSNEARSLPQSARSRCVRPVSVTSSGNGFMASARWNEVFIFEVFPECSTNLEIVVTNQGARSGKGEVVGILPLPIKEEKGQDVSHSSSLWRLISHSIRKEHALPGPQMEFKTYTLKSPRKRSSEAHADNENEKYGSLTAYLHFFTTAENNSPSQDSNKDSNLPNFKDINLWFSLSPDGPWDGVRSSLLLGTIPKEIDGYKVAIDITMKQGHKHATFRSFVTLFNRNKMPLEVCICPVDFVNTNDESPKLGDSSATILLEECFENQRYQSHTGWEYNSLSHFLPTDPGHWSNRDYSKSSQVFLDFDLPSGWIWTSEWTVDKSGNVDHDGWFYGPDFDNLKLESFSRKGSKSPSDCVRRRRWVRSRQHVPSSRRNIFGVVQPGLSIALPVNHGGDKECCVQVRPYVKEPVNSYAWGRVVSQSTSPRMGKVNPFVLSQLEKTEQLVSCLALADVNTHCWLTMESDANVLYNEDNLPFYDWKIIVDAPLKLENLLPCNAEYIIWEKLDSKLAKKEHGVVSAAEHIHLCTVDIRKPIYLTWLNQGGWRPDKEAILLYSTNVEELPRHFWMFHQETQRKLCVSLEYDFGSSASATKVVRLFVPYWISNVASLPLAYRLVELDPNYNASPDSSWMSKAAKIAKQPGQRPTSGNFEIQLHKVVRSLEAVEDSGGIPIMLSPHFPNPLSPRNEDNLLSPRLGFSVALRQSNTFYSGLSFRDFEDSKERVALKAEDEKGHYYKLSVLLDLSSERTKIVHVQPHTLYVNRLGCRLQLRQHNLQHEELLHPNEPAKTFLWWSVLEPEVLKIRLDGYRWSHPFSVSIEGTMHVSLWNELGTKKFIVRTEVRSGGKQSDTLVIFRHVSTHGPYRIENKSSGLPIRFRQAGGDHESWQLLSPCSAMSFAWEDLQREKRLEILIDGADPRTSRTYNIDEDADHQPFPTQRGPTASLRVAVFQDGASRVVKVSDWTPSSSGLELIGVGPQSFGLQVIKGADQGHPKNVSNDASGSQFQTVIELADFGISVVDHTPEELLYLSVQNFILSYAVGVGTKTSRLKLRIDRLQLDNQLPVTPMPVIFSPQDNAKQAEFVLKCSITTQDDGVSDHYVYPYIGIQGPSIPNMPFLINIHEPIIWRIHEMLCRANLGQLTSSQSKAVALDPIIHIGILSASEIRFKVSLAMSPSQRPRGVLGFWSSLLTSLGNTDDMPIRIRPHMQENICMSQSALVAAAVTSIRNDVLSQPLRLLSGVDLLGNASSALGHMSKGVAALSLDKKFIRSRQRQESKGNVEDIGGGIREGGEALAKGLFRGVTGILTKPFEGAKSSGVEGFIQGVGKGVIGAAVQPMSGILDLLSKTTEGANATRMKITAALTSEENLLRHRLPRVISGDNILRPYDEYRAHGQVLLQMAQRSTIFGPMDLFRIRGKFASTDAYEDHFLLPKGRILLITHLRVLLLQQSGNSFGQKRAELFRNPSTICWDIMWKDLDRVELSYGKKDINNSRSHLVFYLRFSSQQLQLESREDVRVVKCHHNTKQALEISAAIQRVLSFQSSESGDKIMKRRVLRPYAGSSGTATPDSPVGLLTPTAGSLMGMSMFSPLAQGIFEPSSRPSDRSVESSSRVDSKGGRFISQFKLIWWNKNEASAEPMSVWRPVPPSGYVAVGHVIQTSYDPPDSAMVYPEAGDGRLAYPQGFQLVWQEAAKASRAALSVFRPLPPQGFVAIGHVCVPGIYEPETDAVKCVRHAFVEATTLNQQPIFRSSNSLRCVFWRLNNNSRTFLAVRDGQSPPSNFAFNVKL